MLINADSRLSSGVSQAINRINTPSTANFALGTGSLIILNSSYFGIEVTADSVPMSACSHNSYELRRTLEFMRESSNE